jgi:hypothetical protein
MASYVNLRLFMGQIRDPAIIERGKMFLQMNQLPGVDNLQNYPAEIIKELEDLLLSGGSAVPDQKRESFYDLENHKRIFFINISPITGRVTLLASWLRPMAKFETVRSAKSVQNHFELREPIYTGLE